MTLWQKFAMKSRLDNHSVLSHTVLELNWEAGRNSLASPLPLQPGYQNSYFFAGTEGYDLSGNPF
ncbi:MAG: hypothetical protein RR320_06480, partial [Oscillospiraceae bacterium]